MKKETTFGKNMMLISTAFRGLNSFSLIPLTLDCPFVEAMFDPSSGVLAVISKVKKESLHMVPRLDEEGQPMRLKFPNNETGKVVKEQRLQIETFSEIYIKEKDEIAMLVYLFAINAEDFDISKYFADVNKTEIDKKDLIILP
jgi:hypothetical protein